MPTPLLLAVVFVSVGLLVGSATSYALSSHTPGRKRLRRLVQPADSSSLEALELTDRPNRVLTKVSRIMPDSPERATRLREQLASAGYRGQNAVAAFRSAQVVMPIALGLIMLAVIGAAHWNLSVLAAGLGFFAPRLVLRRQARRRTKEIENGLPDALDLLVVCLDAGCPLDQGVVKVSDELELAHPALAEELRIVRSEVQAGKPRLEAFRGFAERTRLSEVRSLVAMLGQTDRFGTSIAQALRIHAQTARNKRRQQAEERAARAGVQLVFPLVLCLFPAFYAITLGPALIKFVEVFFSDAATPLIR